MPSSGIWLDSRLKYLSIESKNTKNRLQTRKLWSSEVGASYEQQLTCRTDRHLLSFIFLEHNMSSYYIDPYIYGFYTQRSFRRVYERMKRTSDEKVMIVRSCHSRAHSLLSSAIRAQSKKVSSALHSSCRRAQHKRSAHANSCRRAHAAQYKRSARAAHAEELSTRGQLVQLMQKSSCISCSSCSSCRRAHAAQHKRSAHETHARVLMQLRTRGQLMQLMQNSSSLTKEVSSAR